MKINAVSQNFRGLSNPLTISVMPLNGIIHTLSVQLDNIETTDWNEYRELKRQLSFPPEEVEGDVLTITCAELDNEERRFFINDKPALLGSDLAELRTRPFASEEAFTEYKKEEKLLMKLYTFVAKISMKMANLSSMPVDEEMSRVANEMFTNLANVCGDDNVALKIVKDAIINPRPFKLTSGEINRFIVETMKPFFK